MVTKNDSSDSDPQGSLDEDAELFELRRRILLLRPERRNQLSDWIMERQLDDLAAQLDHAFRICDYATLDIDDENGPFRITQSGD